MDRDSVQAEAVGQALAVQVDRVAVDLRQAADAAPESAAEAGSAADQDSGGAVVLRAVGEAPEPVAPVVDAVLAAQEQRDLVDAVRRRGAAVNWRSAIASTADVLRCAALCRSA